MHRVRSGLIEQRTAKANQIRGLVAEYGLVAPKEIAHLRRALPCWLEDTENGVSDRFRRLLHGLWGDLRSLDDRVSELDREIVLIAQSDPVAKRLQQLRHSLRVPTCAAKGLGKAAHPCHTILYIS